MRKQGQNRAFAHTFKVNGRSKIQRTFFCGVRRDEVVRMKSRLSWFEVRESTVFELKPIFFIKPHLLIFTANGIEFHRDESFVRVAEARLGLE